MNMRAVSLGLGLATLVVIAAPFGPRPGVGPRPPLGERPPRGPQQASEGADVRAVAKDLGSKEAPILFCIGLHIEPFGSTVSSIVGGDRPRPPRANVEGGQRPRPARPGAGGEEQLPPRQQRPGMGGGQRPGGGLDYNEPDVFKMHVGSIQTLAAIIEQHGGKLTVQAQTPFTRIAAENGNSILTDLQKRGHEIALHFHEDAHLGRQSENLPAATWAAVMREEMDLIRKAVGRELRIRYWSGGNLFPGLLDAASAAGLDVMSDHKNPKKQETDPALLAIHPWRPAGGPAFDDVAAFVRHDPKGKIIYLPDGIFADANFRARKQGSDADFLNFLTEGLELSLRAACKDRVNVFHITLHPGELRGAPRAQFQIVATWLSKVIDPLVAAGKVKWASFSEMADAYIAWERAHPEAEPQDKAAAQAPAAQIEAAPPTAAAPAAGKGLSGPGYITFAVNTHDWCHPRDSADTLKRLAEIFKRHGVKGDFYLTAPMAAVYREQCPDVIKTLKDTGMCISYHFRPPHPAYTGFSGKLAQLDGAELEAALRDVETCELDLATGNINKERKGGYALVAEVMGTKPVCVSALCDTPKIKMGLLKLYREMGARMALMYHESGTKVERPFEFIEGLLVRPSDFSITRWKAPGDAEENFWWNRVMSRDGAAYDPTAKLQKELANWKASRPPLITALIHENNYYRRGAETWKAYYLDGRTPLPPPWNLKAADPSRARPKQEVEKIFTAYENLVAYSAKHLKVVTSADLVALAR
jgi:peptidoglycan/xylan/chitin deacetylase (PgdA/CDA1 family)